MLHYNYRNTSSGATIQTITWLTGWSFISICCIIHLFAMNINLFKVILKSFDFWFKFFNGISCIIALSQIRISRQKLDKYYGNIDIYWYVIIISICEFILFTGIFLFDAMWISVHVKIRRYIVICGAMMFTIGWIVDFFRVDDNIDQLNWNPFKQWENNGIGQYTNINFKSVYLSSSANVILFLLKPQFAIVFKKVKK